MKLLLKKIGIYFFPMAILLIALGLGVAAGYVSVTGMAKTFPGAGITMVILMSLIEGGKFIATTWLHKDAAKEPDEEQPEGIIAKFKQRILNYAVTFMVLVVMAITSFGIYGFLSHGYMATANELSKSNKQIELLDKKIEAKQESIVNFESTKKTSTLRITTLNNQRSSLEVRLDSLYARKWWNSVKATRTQIDDSNEEIKKLTQKVSQSDSTIQLIRDEITKLEVEKIEVSNGSAVGEVGPLLYLSSVTGFEMDHIVNYLILVIMFVFDPFAIVLLLAANRSFDKAKKRLDADKGVALPVAPPVVEDNFIEEVELQENNNLVEIEGSVEDVEEEDKSETKSEITGEGDVVYSGEGDHEDVNQKVKEFFDKKEERKKEFTEKLEEIKSESKQTEDQPISIDDFSKSKESVYLNFLEFVFEGGKLKSGDQIPSFQELKNKLIASNVKYSERDLQDFFLICNLLKIVKTDKNKRTALKDYEVARALVSNI